jgi:alpha-L-rhamnosidase
MADHRDEQQPNGVLPSIIPTGGWGYEWGNGPDWTSTIAIIPWTIYQFYGDTTLLADCYDNIVRYVNHIEELYPTGLTNWGLGDWVPVKSKTPVEFTSSVFYFNDVTILAQAAKRLNRKNDFTRYTALAETIRNAINRKYLDTAAALYGTGLQTELSFALHFNIVPQSLQAKVAANLAKRVEQDSFHLDVGLLGTKTILNALSDHGYANHAYKIASQETYPSWGWWIANGATTLYENWDIHAKSDLSMNHIMFGEIGAWLYKALGGIKPDSASPGFSNILLQPHFVDGLDSVNVVYNSVKGEIRSSWKKTATGTRYEINIPANTTATLTLNIPSNKNLFHNNIISGKSTLQLSSGRHLFIIQ